MSKEQYLAQHGERKETLLTLLHDTQTFMEQQGKREDADALRKLQEHIEEGLFSIVLIGEFSAGKSTFLNALMKRRILPAYTRETTAAVNFLRHASKAPNGEPGVVYYRDGRTEVLPDLSVETLTRYVTVGEGDRRDVVAKTTERVDLFLASELLEDGVMLVDSPGLNGITDHLEAITRRQIKESHASIFMFGADRPGSKTDFETLRDLRAQCSRIFIVLNKIDAIKEDEGETVESVIQHLKENYAKQFPGAPLPEIYPISAHQALVARDADYQDPAQPPKDAAYCTRMEESSRLSVFEERLWRYLTQGEKTREELTAPVHTMLGMLKKESSDLNAQIEVLRAERSPDELLRQREALEDKIADLRREEEAQRSPLRMKFRSVMDDIRDRASAECARIADQVVADADEMEDIEDLRQYAAGLQEMLDSAYERRLRTMDDELHTKLMELTDEISDHMVEGVQAALASVPGIRLDLPAISFHMTEVEVGGRLEAMEREFAEKRKEIQEVEAELHRQRQGAAAAGRIEEKYAQLQLQLEQIAARRRNIVDNFSLPSVQIRQKQRVEKHRGGKIGEFIECLFGKEIVEMDVEDRSAQNAARQQKEERLDLLEQERQELLAAMEQYRVPEMGAEEYRIEVEMLRRQREKLHKEYMDAMHRHTEKLEKDGARARKQMLRAIRRYAEDRGEDFDRAVGAGLRQMQQQSFEAVQTMVSARVTEETERYEARLNRIIEECCASDAERDAKLARAEAARDDAIELLNRGLVFETELDAQMQDEIQEGA